MIKIFAANTEYLKGVAELWKRQYCSDGVWKGNGSEITYKKLLECGPDARAIDEAIGNGSWTGRLCSVCGEYRRKVAIWGDEDTVAICEECLRSAADALKAHES